MCGGDGSPCVQERADVGILRTASWPVCELSCILWLLHAVLAVRIDGVLSRDRPDGHLRDVFRYDGFRA